MALSAEDRERVRPVKARVEDDLLALPGVTGVDIDEVAGAAGIVVYADPDALEDVRGRVPTSVGGVPVEVRGTRIELQGDGS